MCETRLNALQSLTRRYRNVSIVSRLGTIEYATGNLHTQSLQFAKGKTKKCQRNKQVCQQGEPLLSKRSSNKERESEKGRKRVCDTESSQCRCDRLIHIIYRATTEAARDKNLN